MAKKSTKTKSSETEPKRSVGRPSQFNPAICEQAVKLCRLGATDKDLADFFGVTDTTINNWKLQHPEFVESLKEGKEIADAEVANRLFNRAIGYEHQDCHVSNYQGDITITPLTKYYAPDTTACIFWLKNRRPDLWRDRQEVTGKDGKDLIPEQQSPLEVARRLAFLFASGLAEADKQEPST